MFIPVWSVVALIHGMVTIEPQRLLFLGCGSTQGRNQIHHARALKSSGLTVPSVRQGPWLSWDAVPVDAHQVAASGPWFLEIFSGTAHLTTAMRDAGIPCLPPIDITVCAEVAQPFDVVDVDRWQFVMQLIWLGAIWFAHFGTPCNTYSAARKEGDGGPPPIRSQQFPDGLPDLSAEQHAQVFLGNLFRDRTCEACAALALMGFHFSIENPLGSLIWSTPKMRDLLCWTRALVVDLDQCFFGAPSKKPTRLLVSHQVFQRWLEKSCPGNHKHVVLKGKVFSQQFGTVVYRTKLAQVYPTAMCSAMAQSVLSLWRDPLQWFQPSFELRGMTADRKRPVGQHINWKPHRQHQSALAAVSSGYQLKRGAMKPLLDIETEPGEAIKWVMSVPHPFSVAPPLDPALITAIDEISKHPARVVARRESLIRRWHQQAELALERSDQMLRAIADVPLRRLLRGVADGQPAQLGKTCNVELYRIMLETVRSADQDLPKLLLTGSLS